MYKYQLFCHVFKILIHIKQAIYILYKIESHMQSLFYILLLIILCDCSFSDFINDYRHNNQNL